ncbi:MAG: hypothetical protein MUF43_12740 [Flavobacterium sp.]|nr:hypothetical protein [Flavobacterium sp.]
MKWLFHFRQKVLRINKEEDFDFETIEIKDEYVLKIKGKKWNYLKDVKGILFRRGILNVSYGIEFDLNKTGEYSTYRYLNEEKRFLIDTLYHSLLENLNSLGNAKMYQNNRILTQQLASKFGLKTPTSIVTNSKKELFNFLDKYKKIAVKGIQEGITIHDGEFNYSDKTTFLTKDDLKNIPSKFGYTHFQEYIEKKFEIRVFYIREKFYSMAIFSQSRELTKIDYRNYQDDWPTRTVPFKVDYDIESKVILLMNKLDLDNGSLDFIMSPNNEGVDC